MTTRRDFLATSSFALAGTVFGVRALHAGAPVRIPTYSLSPANAFLPHTLSPAEMGTLAMRATEAARRVGASYADIRVARRDRLRGYLSSVVLDSQFTYGVRALVDGVWGFAYGREPSVDAITRCAQDAVTTARLSAALTVTGRARDWEPPAMATGEWRMPITVDPFTVPIRHQAELMSALWWTVGQVPGAGGGLATTWSTETRVIAATTGTLVTQRRYFADVHLSAGVRYGNNRIDLMVPGLHSAPAGYEILLATDLQDRIKAAALEAVEFSRLPMRALDVGRYPIVLDGNTMASLVTTVIGPSAELDRVLGYDLDASGSSRWTPDLLGTLLVSPLITVSGHRTYTPGHPEAVNATQWDDEGCSPQPHTTIKHGMLMDYHTSAQTVAALKDWYAKQGRPLQSNGCVVAETADKMVLVRSPHLTMDPGSTMASLDDLCQEMRKGVLAMRTTSVTTDQQLSSGTINTREQVFEVSGGKMVRRLKGNALQFNTLPFLKGLATLGDRTTMRTRSSTLDKGMPWQTTLQSATAPAGLFKEIDVISTGR